MAETRMAKAKKNVISSFMRNMLSLLLVFVSRIIFVRVLDAGYLGINGLFTNILNVLSMADLGMGTAMMYSLYKPIAENNVDKINALIAFFKKIYSAIALAVLAVGLAVMPFLDYIVKLDKPIVGLRGYYFLALLNVVMSYLFVYRTTLLTADQKGYILNKYIMIFKGITFIVQTCVLVLFKNYFLYLAAALVISFVSNLVQNLIALKYYPYLKNKSFSLDKKEKKRIARDVKATFIYKISGTIQENTDSILISVFAGTIFVGYYSNYSIIFSAVVSIINLLFNAIKASIGNLIASNEASQEEKIFYYKVLDLINFWIVGWSSICLLCLIQDFIQLVFGTGYTLEFPVVGAIVLNFYVTNIRQTLWVFRETTGLFHETRYIVAVTAVLNLFLSLLFGYFWGITGIIAATIIAKMAYAWWKEPMVLFRKFFDISAKAYYFTYIKRICLCGIGGAATICVCYTIDSGNMYVEFVERIIICCIIPNILFLICYLKTPEFQYIFKRLIKPIIKKKNPIM